MSYILDALKRAEAQRERGATPGLHSHHALPSNAAPAMAASARVRLVSASLLITTLAVGGWWLWQARQPQAPSRSVPITPARPTPVAQASPPPAVPVALQVSPVAPAATLTSAAPIEPVTAAALVPAPVVPVVSKPLPKPVEAAPTQAPKTSPVAQAAPAASSVSLLSELAEETRRQIPKITITGSVYSSTPAQRLLLVNNLVLTQGSQVAPEVTLEEIQPASSIFSFRGTRFRVAH